MALFNIVINVVLVVATLVVICFAWQTVTESRKATKTASDTVTRLGDLLTVAHGTAEPSEAAAEAARQTVETARAAHQADERDRLVRQLRDIGQLVESAGYKAAAEEDSRQGPVRRDWLCVDQQYIAVAIAWVDVELPQCDALAGARTAFAVKTYAANARSEITAELRKLHVAGNA